MIDLTHILAAGAYGNPGPTAPSPDISSKFNQIVGDLKWAAGAFAIVGVFIVAMLGVVAHQRGETTLQAFGGFVKIAGLVIVASSGVGIVSALLS